MGDAFAGIVHPCKVYNILAIGSPFIYIGPAESHIADLLSRPDLGFRSASVPHGEVERVVEHILSCANEKPPEVERGASNPAAEFSMEVLMPRMVEALEASRGATGAFDAVAAETKAHSA
jgi:hypothetical protein